MKEKIISLLSDGQPWADRIVFLDCVGSTNDLAKKMAAQGAPDGTVIVASQQTDGRGRRGRSFQSLPGMGVYMTAILRPQCMPTQLMHLTCAVAVAMCNAVERAVGIRPGIKWTNDLVYEKRKLGGILTELALNPATGAVDAAIVGIGINCCHRISDFDPSIQGFAGSLSMISGKVVSREAVAAAIVDELWKMDRTILAGKAKYMAQYRKNCITLHQEVSLVHADRVERGTAVDVDPEGALVVKMPDGTVKTVNSGEVSVRGMYGYIS